MDSAADLEQLCATLAELQKKLQQLRAAIEEHLSRLHGSRDTEDLSGPFASGEDQPGK